ncbi:unnamed protein product [Dimorphilus gyrociliatus]|uniref:Uncharacterized protein n=1 Tax=Dimorphilus gyrociliatus TaxID=2664684 RepID=A0A7I8VZQ6_9ANNE|nr:unnamed protein product [Dimorphilus gyrociliatus]
MEVLLRFLLIISIYLPYSWEEDCSIRRVGSRLEIDVDANRYCGTRFEQQQQEAEKVSQDERDMLYELGEKFHKFRKDLDDCQSSKEKLKRLYEEERRKSEKQNEKIEKLESLIEKLMEKNDEQKKQLREQEEKLKAARTLLQTSMDFNEELKRNHSYLEDEFENCTDDFRAVARQNKVLKQEVRKWMRLAKILRKQLAVVLPTLNRCRNCKFSNPGGKFMPIDGITK